MMLSRPMRTSKAMPPRAVRRRALVGSQGVKAQAVEERERRMEVEVVVGVEEEHHRPMGLQRVVDRLRLRLRKADLPNDLSIGRHIRFCIFL